MTQRQLASELGITDSYLSDILFERKTGDKAQKHIARMFIILGMEQNYPDVAQAQIQKIQRRFQL